MIVDNRRCSKLFSLNTYSNLLIERLIKRYLFLEGVDYEIPPGIYELSEITSKFSLIAIEADNRIMNAKFKINNISPFNDQSFVIIV